MDTTLDVTARTEVGEKGANRRLRAGGAVPGTIMGGGRGPAHVVFDGATFLELFRRSGSRNTIVQLRGAESVPALVGEVQRHPLSRSVLHVDFRRLPPGAEVEVEVPVTTTGKPAGATQGGRVRIVHRALRVRCPWESIPATLDVDVTPMEVGDSVKASGFPLPAGVSFVARGDFHIVELLGARKEIAEAAPAAAAPAAPAAAAPGAAKPGAAPAKK
jgi:large subunit ribosomal protein L25